jgi:zinc/manganese transport system permease protein
MTMILGIGDPLAGLRDMLSHPFMRYAFIAGTATAIPAGLVSYFVVLRRQVFSGDALGHAAFTGALAALAFGVDLRLGLFAVTVASALLLGSLGEKARADDVAIGSFFAWVLGLGVLFLSIFTTSRSTGNGAGGVRVLFGSIFGLDASHTWVTVAIGAGVTVALVGIARPLLFASIDEGVAEARRIPVRLLGYAFLAIVGISAAQASQAVGALLILGLLAAPGGIAQRLTARPYAGMLVSVIAAVGSVWIGLALSFALPKWPPSFSILAAASAIYVLALVFTSIARLARTAAAAPPALGLADSSA